MPDTAKITRDSLSALTRDERLIRYLEGLAQEIDDRAIQYGEGPPSNLRANLSRTYYDILDGDVWINTSLIDRDTNGWINKG